MSILSNILAAIAGGFSGSESKLCSLNIWADVDCPKELL